MIIKTIKLKAEKGSYEFDYADYLVSNTTTIATHAQIVQEEEGLFWHLLIIYTYNPNQKTDKTKSVSAEFVEEIRELISHHPNITSQTKNIILTNLEKIINFTIRENFTGFRGINTNSINSNKDFFEGILKIAKKQ